MDELAPITPSTRFTDAQFILLLLFFAHTLGQRCHGLGLGPRSQLHRGPLRCDKDIRPCLVREDWGVLSGHSSRGPETAQNPDGPFDMRGFHGPTPPIPPFHAVFSPRGGSRGFGGDDAAAARSTHRRQNPPQDATARRLDASVPPPAYPRL